MIARVLRSAAVLLAAVAPTVVPSQAWAPTRTVEFVVAAGPAGALDQVARVMKQVFAEQKILDKPFIVVNRPGGAGKVAFDVLAARPGDPQGRWRGLRRPSARSARRR